MPEESEIATLIVGGGEFSDWETVWVQDNYTDSYLTFRFTCAERETGMKIEPGDECEIRLGNQKAVTGVILTRQVAYDANSHGVMLQGVSLTWYAGRSSVMSKTGNYDGMTFEEIAEKILDPTGIKFKPVGKISKEKFTHCQVMPGEKIFDFLERIGRERKIIIAADRDGKYLLVGEHDSENIGTLKEGVNIKSCQAVISDAATHSEYVTRAQCWARNSKKYREPAQQEARAKGTAARYSVLYTPVEHPVWTDKEVELRCNMEQMWHEGQDIQVTVVVQGWFTQGGTLWKAGSDVSFDSPMAMIKDTLKIQSVTFSQDSNSGTLTTLLCVTPWGLNGARGLSRGGKPDPAKIDKSPAKDPPKFTGIKKG